MTTVTIYCISAGTGSMAVQVHRVVKAQTSATKPNIRMQKPTHWKRNGTPTR